MRGGNIDIKPTAHNSEFLDNTPPSLPDLAFHKNLEGRIKSSPKDVRLCWQEPPLLPSLFTARPLGSFSTAALEHVTLISNGSLDRVFAHALNTIKRIPRTGSARPPSSARLKLYGLYKQSMEGDVEGVMSRPAEGPAIEEAEREKW